MKKLALLFSFLVVASGGREKTKRSGLSYAEEAAIGVVGGRGHGHGHGHNHNFVPYSPSPLPLKSFPYPPVGNNYLGSLAPLDTPIEISKSVYVFAPPESPEYVRPNILHKIPAPKQKHFQLIFINAPSPPPPSQHTVELPPAPEQKTKVYVLLKTPEIPPPVKIIPGSPPPLGKPEVYFIRYKGQHYGDPGYGPVQDNRLNLEYPGTGYDHGPAQFPLELGNEGQYPQIPGPEFIGVAPSAPSLGLDQYYAPDTRTDTILKTPNPGSSQDEKKEFRSAGAEKKPAGGPQGQGLWKPMLPQPKSFFNFSALNLNTFKNNDLKYKQNLFDSKMLGI